jgi:predicted double-glycine peptidase
MCSAPRPNRNVRFCTVLVVAVCLLAVADSPGMFREEAAVYCQVAQNAIKVPLPEIHQADYYSCGAAALMSIGSYYGVGPEDLDTWKTDLDTRTDTGTDVEPIVQYARNNMMLDVTLIERNMTDGQLCTALDAAKPVLCLIQAYGEPAEYEKLNENGHYVVAIGYDRANVYFMDPKLTGRRGFLSWPEFHRRWHENLGTERNPDVHSRLGIVIGPKQPTMSYFSRARRID